MNPASLQDWKAAVIAAVGALSHGSMGAYVRAGESWPHAIIREAGQFLASEALGRPKGPPLDNWTDVAIEWAHKGSAAPDGRVAYEHGLRLTVRDVNARWAADMNARAWDGGVRWGRV